MVGKHDMQSNFSVRHPVRRPFRLFNNIKFIVNGSTVAAAVDYEWLVRKRHL
jgi:hypothetical protein